MMRSLLVGLIGLALGVAGTLAMRAALSKRGPSAAADTPSADIRVTSCSLAEPMRIEFLFDCDVIGEAGGPLCDRDKGQRKLERDNAQRAVLALRERWSYELRDLRVIERFESGEVAFNAQTAQRVLDATFGAMRLRSVPKAPTSMRGFLSLVECAPYTWSSILLSSLPSLTDVDAKDMRDKLPQLATIDADFQQRLAFLNELSGTKP